MTDSDQGCVGDNLNTKLDPRFIYHPPQGTQADRYQQIRNSAKALATMIEVSCPPSPERDLACTRVREASMWANASIACNE